MIAILFPIFLAAQSTSPAKQPSPAGDQPTLQTRFDEASALAVDGKCGEAVPKFKALENEPAVQRNPIVRAAIAVRKGMCLASVDTADTAVQSIRAGLPLLESKGEAFAVDVQQAHTMLGRLAATEFDYGGAEVEFRAALQGAKGLDRLQPLLSLSQVLAFDHDGQALRYVEEARALVKADPGANKKLIAIVQAQYARVLMNEVRLKEAYAALRDSVAKQGGLSLRVTLDDVTTRSDLAIAAMLNDDAVNARRYLAYAGAGTARSQGFMRAASLETPPCSSLPGLKPDDFAVVEFALSEKGEVLGATPIYVPAGREAALTFARAVSQWSWTPEGAMTLPPFFRQSVRVELRCSRSGERPSLTAAVDAAFGDWVDSHTQVRKQWAGLPHARALALQTAALGAAETSGDRAGALAAAVAIAENPAAPFEIRKAHGQKAAELVQGLQAPASVQLEAALAASFQEVPSDEARDRRLRELLATPAIAADPLSSATVRMLLAAPRSRARRAADADALLAAVSDGPGLPDRHPLRIAALVERANLLARRGDLAAARAMFDRTGLTEEQCSLIETAPAMQSRGFDNTDRNWLGFDGWANVEFDIAADGKPLAPRVVNAYPPFVFDKPGADRVKTTRFTGSFRPNNGVACTAKQQFVSFVTP